MRFRYLFYCLAFVPLAACDHAVEDKDAAVDQVQSDANQLATQDVDDAERIATMARDNIKKTGNQFRAWLLTPPAGPPGPQPITASYCYRTLQDILCYRQPMPGWEGRLVAYQGSLAKAPPAAVMQPLPIHVEDIALSPEKRAANSKPVFATAPAEIKDETKNNDQGIVAPTVDATHEQLPNPATSPQL